MDRDMLPRLPRPLARALLAFLDEDLPRAADELSDLLRVTLEYVAAIAVAEYLEHASDPSLNGWLAAQLATGKAEAGHWARWTQLALAAAQPDGVRSVPELSGYLRSQDLDDPGSDVSWLLAFRNRVMHGGFVAPLPTIRTAVTRMRSLLASLAPLWTLRPVGRVEDGDSVRWFDGRGLAPSPIPPPAGASSCERPGAVLLVDASNTVRLALDPACVIEGEGRLELQEAWQTNHPRLFERVAIAAYFGRYQRERRGLMDAAEWSVQRDAALPPRGLVPNPTREEALAGLLQPGRVVRLVGPVGSGRSTLLHTVATTLERPLAVLAVEPHSVRQDPAVVARWTLQALSLFAFGQDAPPEALLEDGPSRHGAWFDRLGSALTGGPGPVLAIDDADLVGGGLYTAGPRTDCLRHARRFGVTVVLVHRPAGEPPESGDAVLHLPPLDAAALRAWGDPEALLATTGGHLALLSHPETGRASLRARLLRDAPEQTMARAALEALRGGSRTATEVAEAIGAFTPAVERVLRALLDHLEVSPRASFMDVLTVMHLGRERTTRVATTERVYALHPAVALVLEELSR